MGQIRRIPVYAGGQKALQPPQFRQALLRGSAPAQNRKVLLPAGFVRARFDQSAPDVGTTGNSGEVVFRR